MMEYHTRRVAVSMVNIKLGLDFWGCGWNLLGATLPVSELRLLKLLLPLRPLGIYHTHMHQLFPQSLVLLCFLVLLPDVAVCCNRHICHNCGLLLFVNHYCIWLASRCPSFWNSKSHRTFGLLFWTTFSGVSHQELGRSNPHVAQIFLHTTIATWLSLSVYVVPTCILRPAVVDSL